VVIELAIGSIYRIELCSGEQRRWRYLGPDSRAVSWWIDLENGREFNEISLMYAWTIIAKETT
jgi:hypothetical protein